MYLARLAEGSTSRDYWARSYQYLTFLPRPLLREVFLRSPVHRLASHSIPERGTVLDAGCGFGVLSILNPHPECRIVGIDQSPELIGIARRLCPESSFVVASLDHIPALPGSFDMCFAISSLELVPGGPPFTEIHRVLRAGGILFLVCPRLPTGFVSGISNRVDSTMGTLRVELIHKGRRREVLPFPSGAYGYYYTCSELRKAADSAGFRCVRSMRSDFCGGLGYSNFPGPIVRRQLLSWLRDLSLDSGARPGGRAEDDFILRTFLFENPTGWARPVLNFLLRLFSYWNVLILQR